MIIKTYYTVRVTELSTANVLDVTRIDYEPAEIDNVAAGHVLVEKDNPILRHLFVGREMTVAIFISDGIPT